MTNCVTLSVGPSITEIGVTAKDLANSRAVVSVAIWADLASSNESSPSCRNAVIASRYVLGKVMKPPALRRLFALDVDYTRGAPCISSTPRRERSSAFIARTPCRVVVAAGAHGWPVPLL